MIPRNHKVVMIPSFTVEDRHEWWSSLPAYCRSQLSYKSRSRTTDRLHLGEAEIVSQQREHENSHSQGKLLMYLGICPFVVRWP